jgi:nucleotide-binding universal stress UspA family protein
MRTIVIGSDGSAQAEGAMRFGGALARAMGARVIVGTAYIHTPPLRGDGGAFERLERSDAEEIARRGAASVSGAGDIEARVVSGSTVAEGLHRLAAEVDADLLVIATSGRRRIGSHQPRSVSEQVVHHSPCPVAVVPPRDGEPALSRIGIAVDGSPATREALAFAVELAARAAVDAPAFRLLHVSRTGRLEHVPQPGSTSSHEHGLGKLALEGLAVELAAHGDVQVVGETGDPGEELVRMSETLDLLVCGSRDQGAVKRLLLGSVSTHLVRHATIPVIVVPASAAAARDRTASSGRASV